MKLPESSLIDHITTNTPEKISLSGVIHTGISDHSLVFAIRNRLESNKVPWITSEIKNLINKRDKLKRKAIISKSEIYWINYKTSRNQINIELRNAKQNYYSTKITGQKCNPKIAWKSINNLLGKQTKQTVVNKLNMGESTLK